MLRNRGRRYVYPDARRFTVSLSDSEMRHVDMLCRVMNVSRAELFRMFLTAVRAGSINHQGEKA